MRRKVSIIGAGNVGASAAERIVMRRLADVVLVDIVEGMPQGKSLDLNEAGPVDGYDMRLTGANGYDATSGSDVVVITSGLPRKPGMSRDDLLAKNFEIVKQVTTEVAKRSPNAVLIIVSNPLDAMAHTALKVSGFPRQRVLGMAGVLDSARMSFFISEALGVSVADTNAFVLGGHGDTMVPLPRYSTVAGIPITELIPKDKLDAMAHTALKVSGFPRERVLGMAGVLDSARMRFFIADALGVSASNIHAFVLGGHGDTMVPLPRYSTVAGVPITELLPAKTIEAIVQRTRDGGIEVVNLLKSGSAYYAPASSVVQMAEAILLDDHRILPCAAYLQGEYGYRDLFLGVPAQLGSVGLEKVIEIKLTPDEKTALDRSAAAVRELVGKLPL